ncbi:nuclear transport factor 2 family protein [Thalassotalea litorea]|uniref:Nuclear transport factor 2 family protein n=1 Tax=Thalassotalea litorea TaxID=2020715 RepID=A0A5R9IYB1_9GAMM|nr:nuclear transport factor 2 family protein [Thalassotalea litorea]TLU66908.1 nuclear transport factor 2 family protein [Thalassotalea litorea]
MTNYQTEKAYVLQYFDAMENASIENLAEVQQAFIGDDYEFFGVYPFNKIENLCDVTANVWHPIYQSFKQLQRRQDVFMAGTSEINGETWVMSMGHFMGLFDADWTGIRANRKVVMLRYAEFNCVENGKITKTGLWLDIIGLMHQVGINPLPPQTGASFVYPGPRHHNGLLFEQHDPVEADKTMRVLNTMIDDLSKLNQTGNDRAGPEVMQKNWHDNMTWYGPAGIGATYTIPRYQEQHMYPFREGLTDKVFNGHVCRFAEGQFACFFGWPNLSNKSQGGFMGLPSGDVRADMRVVDVYYREGDKLLENWVLIDIPYWLKQQGVDILERTASILNPTLD